MNIIIKMRTNKEKWDYYKGLIDEREQKFIDIRVSNKPKELYEVTHIGHLTVLTVTGIKYSNGLHYFTKIPKKTDVTKIKEYYENPPELSIANIRVHWERRYDGWKSTSATKYTELIDEKNAYQMDKALADVKVKELKEKRAHEEELLANGHIRCTYCNKVIPESEAIDYTIIFQNSRPDPTRRSGWKKFVDKKTNKYCPSGCGVYDQMAHEG